MDTVRGLSVTLGAALLGSFSATLLVVFRASLGAFEWLPIFGVTLIALIFTTGGSAMLGLIYAAAWTLGPIARYALLIISGATVGGGLMLLLGGAPAGALGVSYGVTTALAWVILHRLIYGPEPSPPSGERAG